MKRLILMLVFLVPTVALAELQSVTEANVLRGQFTESRVLKDFATPLKSQGHFVIAPRYGLLWVNEKPFNVTTVIGPSGIVQSVDGQETTRLSSDRMPFMMRLYTMLSSTLAGDWAPLEEDFIVSRSGTKDAWKVDLKPRRTDEPSMPFEMIHVKGSQFVEQVVMKKRGGESDTLNFSRQKLSKLPLDTDEQLYFSPEVP